MHKLHAVLLCLMLLPGAAAAATLGDARTGFSADRTLVIDGHSYTGKIWAMPGEERHEQAIQAFRPIFLLRADNPLGEVVLPQLKTIVQFVMPAELRLLGSAALKQHPIGHDTVNGIATTRYAIDESVPEGHAAGTLWLSRDDIPMKLVGTFAGNKGKVATVRWELSHVKIGPQPAVLFEEPHGFSRLPAEAVAPLLGLKLKSGKH
ncbi:MAG TPA: hypothetical protein VKQ73_02370 [Stellaceae bacterium]|nr:hypothetical protein [Stellaceae bacterium]